MALTVTQLAAALRLGDGVAAPPEPLLSVLTRQLATATALIDARLGSDSGAPESLLEEAAIRIAGYLYDQPDASAGQRHTSAWFGSGASALLAPWIPRRATPIDKETGGAS